MEGTTEFTGYKWAGLSFSEGSFWHCRAQSFLASVNWEALCDFASSLHSGKRCIVESEIALGGRHMVRIIQFEDNSRWIARLRMPARSTSKDDSIDKHEAADNLLKREFDCLQLVKERTTVPVPTVFGYSNKSKIGAPVILMECLLGNVGTDLNFDFIPPKYKNSFFEEMARIQTEISSILFPKIGSIIRLENGSYDIGPIPGLGGPFDTATEYFRAWSATIQFPHPASFIENTCGNLGADIAKSTAEFPQRIGELAEMLPVRDSGPFPLRHIDFGHNNILVDDNYKVLGVIDWEHAFAAPWETVDFPLTLSTIPEAMDAPWNYDEHGVPKDEKIRERLVDRKDYIAAVCQAEGSGPPILSSILNDQKVQDLATAMRLYATDGKMGLYSKVLDIHHSPKVIDILDS
ncbi:hypothetical protein TESG_03977 [Trichophyton tonsurans CBS 112818]|uniref:Aminoglycoside phosphotransferase domain-containing protein n=1 Tax=Trichophyton tonsurans (strain CBS 112818) TaxID=647933 RepID=F2RYY8_TRIT1|nr:hypothetical protein TESG_03977 [Trichophyton tonsurans CBS 112818]